MDDTPPPFIVGMRIIDDLIIWIAPHGEFMMVFVEPPDEDAPPGSDWGIEFPDELDPDLPF